MIALLLGCAPDLGPASAQSHEGRCGECHPTHQAQLESSRHARAAESALFVALRERAGEAAGFCDRCHSASTGACNTCHAAAGNRVAHNGELVHDPTGPVRGPLGHTRASHATAPGAFLQDGALCGTCHDLSGFAGFDEHPFATATAAGDPRCQDCHMSPEPGVPGRTSGPWVAGGEVRVLSDHRFVGLQALPELLVTGLELTPAPGGVWARNLTPHGFPDGASWSREIWLGDTPLHTALFDGDTPVSSPLEADRRVFRGLEPGEVRWIESERVCLSFRPVNAGLARELGLEVPPRVELTCVAASP